MTTALLIHLKANVPLCADLLALASDVLPVVARGGLVLCGDLYTALERAAGRLELRGGRGDLLVVADQARDLFVVYLMAAGRAGPEMSLKQTLRTWLVAAAGHDLAVVASALAAAAEYWRNTPQVPSTPAVLVGAVGR